MTEKKLTPKQQAFVDAYTGPARGNATEAARMAGYKGNANTLRVVGAENLAKPAIAEAVARANAPAQNKARLSRAALQGWLEDVITGDVEGEVVMTEDGPVEMGPRWSDKIQAAKLLAAMRGHLLKPDVIRESLQELKAKMPPDAYRALLLALQDG